MIEHVTLDENKREMLEWMWEKNKIYTVTSCYNTVQLSQTSQQKRIWKIKVPTQIHAFMWLTVKNTFLTWDNFQRREWSCSGLCYL